MEEDESGVGREINLLLAQWPPHPPSLPLLSSPQSPQPLYVNYTKCSQCLSWLQERKIVSFNN